MHDDGAKSSTVFTSKAKNAVQNEKLMCEKKADMSMTLVDCIID